MLRRVKRRRATKASVRFFMVIDNEQVARVRHAPPSASIIRPCDGTRSALLEERGSAGSKRPCRRWLSRLVRLRPYESSYFLASGPSSGQLASMFTDFEALWPALCGPGLLEAVAAEIGETAKKVNCTSCSGAHDDSVGVSTPSGRCPGPDLRPGACGRTGGSVRTKSPDKERG